MTAELEVPFTGRGSTSRSLQSKAENSYSEPTEEEWEAFEAFLGSLEELEEAEIDSEVNSGSLAFEIDSNGIKAEASKEQISPELEAVFVALKKRYEERRAIYRESAPFSRELRQLKHRQIEIITDDLVGASGEETMELSEEFDMNEYRMQELHTMISPLEEHRLQLEKEMEQIIFEYGMTVEEFYRNYDAHYKSWESEQ